MGAAIGVYRLEETDSARFAQNLTTRPLSLPGFGSRPATPYSDLEYIEKESSETRRVFRAIHVSDVRRQTIRAIIEEGRDPLSGLDGEEYARDVDPSARVRDVAAFQWVHRFKVVMDFKEREIQVHHRVDVAESLMTRLRVAGIVRFTPLRFDLRRIGNVPGVKGKHTVYAEVTDDPGVSVMSWHGPALEDSARVQAADAKSIRVSYDEDGAGPVIGLWVSSTAHVGTRAESIGERQMLAIFRRFQLYLGLTQPTIESDPARFGRREAPLF